MSDIETDILPLAESRQRAKRSEHPITKALKDLARGLSMFPLWIFLGWREVSKIYSRSVLGPLWMTLSMGVMVGSLGLLYSQIYRMDVSKFLPFLAVGFILWNFISGLINDGCYVFSWSGHYIKQTNLPLSIYPFRLVCTQFIIFLHNFLIYIVVAIVFRIWPGPIIFLIVPAVMVIAVNGFFAALILGPLCSRYRDVPLIISSLVQVAFFLTPILWSADRLPERAHFVEFNPFYHFIELTRVPLLGGDFQPRTWVICLGITAVHGALALLAFVNVRSRIAYWV
jgi:ABC-2 type transport system permease protein/lipopolysaccharide transport system permease protein